MSEEYGSYPKLQIGFVRDDPSLVVRGDTAEEMEALIKTILPIYKRFKDAVDKGREIKAETKAQEAGLTSVCPDCGAKMLFKKGTSKSGKPWSGLFCPNADREDKNKHRPVWL